MPVLTWDASGTRFYETGTDRAVLYIPTEAGAYTTAVAWNGITAVTQKPTGGEPNKIYADNILYGTMYSNEDFEATIEAFTYPEEFETCQGNASVADGAFASGQKRQMFGLSYRTLVYNDLGAEAYKIHMLWGLTAKPSEKGHKTVNDNPEATPFSWDVTSLPALLTGFKPVSHIAADSRTVTSAKWSALTDALWGTQSNPALLPTPDAVRSLLTT